MHGVGYSDISKDSHVNVRKRLPFKAARIRTHLYMGINFKLQRIAQLPH